ncbi:unnamed protein product [Meganyctiphanes norvegica]|uniref:Uncharacterized protein n=1 Tax=Meganyctiphanes norvegica TaxID=48144 RepID=A0AAV2RDS0_MEGNR
MKEEERDTLGFRVGGPTKGRENDVSATFRSLAEYKFYPNREPSRVPVHGDLLDNMLCPSTEQVMLVEEVAKKSGKRIKTYHELTKKHDMNEMGYSKKDKHTAYKPPPPKRTKKTTKKTTPTKEPTKSPSKKTPKKSPSKLNRGNAFLYGPSSSSMPSDTPSISPPASPPAKRKILLTDDQQQPPAKNSSVSSPPLPSLSPSPRSISRILTPAEKKQPPTPAEKKQPPMHNFFMQSYTIPKKSKSKQVSRLL